MALTRAYGNDQCNTCIASRLLEMCKEPVETITESNSEWTSNQIERLKGAAELHLQFSGTYLPKLRTMSQIDDSDKNTSPWITLKEGSYYLGNAYRSVTVHKNLTRGLINDKNVQTINDTLLDLGFDPIHITSGYTDEAYGGQAKCFVSRGQGTKYYELLHSNLKKDVRSFVKMVECSIDIPVMKFLESINQKIQFVLPEKFCEAIENNDHLEVEYRIKEGVDVNSWNTDGRTPLHYAVDNANLGITSVLLKNGADATQVTTEGNTPLHIAASKDLKEIAEALLQHVNHDKLNDFINAQTIQGHTSLHLASRNGCWEIVKSLLKHGAIYNIQNKKAKVPLNLTRDCNIANLLKLTSNIFQDAKNGNPDIICKLR